MSIRFRLLSLGSRLIVKPFAGQATAPQSLRRAFERFARVAFPLPPLTWLRPVTLAPGLSGLMITPRPASRPPVPGRMVMWLHGGAFVSGSARSHAGLVAQLAEATGATGCTPEYRLAPEAPFPASVDDARAAFDGLLARGYAPENIILGGDSAGGNLTLGLLAALLADGIRPAGVVLISPVTDLTFSGASVTENLRHDVVLPGHRREEAKQFYLGDVPADDPRASPLFADFKDPPPVYFQYATTEILRDDSRRMADKLEAAGGRVVRDEWPDGPHVFAMFSAWIPEAREVVEDMARFINGLWDS